MRAAILGRLALASPSVQKHWSGWLHFTNSSMSDPLNSALAAVLQQWSTPRNMLRCGENKSVPRLDCHYAWCGWPSQDAALRGGSPDIDIIDNIIIIIILAFN